MYPDPNSVPRHTRRRRFAGRRAEHPLRHRLIIVAVAVVAAVGVAAASYAASPFRSRPGAVACDSGQALVVYPGGKWECAANPHANPTPSGTPTTSPSTSPSTSPTTPAPTTTSSSPTTAPSTTNPGQTPNNKLTGCFARLAECGYPSRATTGVPAGVNLSAYTGPTTITTAGTVIDGKTMGCLTVKAANVVIKRSKITGPCFWGISVSGGSLRVEDSIIDCTNYKGTGIGGSNWTVLRTQLLRCENGADVAGGNNTIADSYIAEVKEVDGGHGDGIQAYTGGGILRNVTVRHNTFDLSNPITSSLIMGYPAENLLVENNFFAAGAFTVYCPNNPPITNVVYRNNRFYGPSGNWQSDVHRPAFGYTDGCNKSTITWTGNYADNNLAPINP